MQTETKKNGSQKRDKSNIMHKRTQEIPLNYAPVSIIK